MAVINTVRTTTRVSRERLLTRYKEKAFRKILEKIFRAARKGEESVEVDLSNLFSRSFGHDFFTLFKDIIIDTFHKEGFYIETYTICPKITISWRPRK